LLSFSPDGHKGNGPEWSLGSVIICRHCISTTVTLCFVNGLQLNLVIVHVDFELAAMKVLKEIF